MEYKHVNINGMVINKKKHSKLFISASAYKSL